MKRTQYTLLEAIVLRVGGLARAMVIPAILSLLIAACLVLRTRSSIIDPMKVPGDRVDLTEPVQMTDLEYMRQQIAPQR